MMSLAYILSQDQKASVLILPSNHFIRQETAFAAAAQHAMGMLDERPDKFILFGAEATSSSPDYSWIDVSPPNNQNRFYDNNQGDFVPIRALHMKPDVSLVRQLYRKDALWNTSIVAAKAKYLWMLCKDMLPCLFERAEHVHQVTKLFDKSIGGDDYIKMAVSHAYYHLQASSLLSNLLVHATSESLALNMRNIDWVNWSMRHRIIDTIQRYNLHANFKYEDVA